MRSYHMKLDKNFRYINRDTTINNTKSKHSILTDKKQIWLASCQSLILITYAQHVLFHVEWDILRHTFLKRIFNLKI